MSEKNSPIGVFDSGVGGISVLGELWNLMPNENYIYFGDSANAPYGTKPESEIKKYTEDNIKSLINMGAKAIVIACNTATSVAAKSLRSKYTIPIIGIEPAVKPAATNHNGGRIVVMATPVTLKKEKFTSLMESYSDVSEIIPLPCPNLVEIIERGVTDGREIHDFLTELFRDFDLSTINAVVLGCTHYPFIKEAIHEFFNSDVDIIDGGYGTAAETKRRLAELDMLNDSRGCGQVNFISSKNNFEEINLMQLMFEKSKTL